VGLKREYKNRYPHQLSGGERQRVGIARAIATNPKFIIADEPVSSLDAPLQAQILKLLGALKDEHHLTYLFISHNLNTISLISDRVLVMYLGKIMELAEKKDFFEKPLHPYSQALISAASYSKNTKEKRIILKGEIPSALNPPSGCVFRTRCLYAQKLCEEKIPPLEVKIPNSPRLCACHFPLV
jgi:oligopeptide/dipeptide ABC transporter ATP-binding protein